MSASDVTVVLAHGGWADGSSWHKVIAAQGEGLGATTIRHACLTAPSVIRWLR